MSHKSPKSDEFIHLIGFMTVVAVVRYYAPDFTVIFLQIKLAVLSHLS